MKKDLADIICCPTCKGNLELKKDVLTCRECKTTYYIENGILNLLPKE